MSENIDKPYVLYVAEIIYLEIFNIKKNNNINNLFFIRCQDNHYNCAIKTIWHEDIMPSSLSYILFHSC